MLQSLHVLEPHPFSQQQQQNHILNICKFVVKWRKKRKKEQKCDQNMIDKLDK